MQFLTPQWNIIYELFNLAINILKQSFDNNVRVDQPL